jgi:AmmeMemoRadiSam system protein A
VLDGRRPELDPSQLDDDLKRPSGAFVTLHTNRGDLRGCIGSIQAVAPLCDAVVSNAINAAFRDPRFYPVQREELAELQIEISVMSPIEPVANVEEIEVGRDGLIISRGSRAGLLLPQVATEYAWDRETFLQQTCVKAGLPPDAWRSPETRIERFSAEVFGE